MTLESDVLPAPAPDSDSRLLLEAYARSRQSLWIGAAAASAGAVLIGSFFPAWAIIAWLAAIWVTSALGLAGCMAFNRAAPHGEGLARWRLIFTAQAVTSGLAWGLGPAMLLWRSTAPGTGTVLLVGALFAVCAAAMVSLVQVKLAMQGFVAAALLPAAVSALLAPGGSERATGFILLAGLGVFIAAGRILANTLEREVATQVHLQCILDNAPDAVVNMDATGQITGLNPRAQALLGWSPQEVLGYEFDGIIELRLLSTGKKVNILDLAEPPGSGSAARVEVLVERRGGTPVNAEIAVIRSQAGQKLRFTAFAADITQRVESVAALALFRDVLEATGHNVVIADANGHGIYQNPAHARASGYSDDELASAGFELAPRAENAREVLAEVNKSLAETGFWSGQLRFHPKGGHPFTSHSDIGSIADAQGKVQYRFNLFTDITPLLAQAQELRETKDEAERVTGAKSEMFFSMSRQLSAPLNTILGSAQIMELDATLSVEQRARLAEITQGGRQLLERVTWVQDLAQIESGSLALSLEPVFAGSAIAESWLMLQPLAASRKLTLHKQASQGVRVMADRVRLKQVLLNLMSNAIKHSREYGELSIRVALSDAETVRFEVRDTGVGIGRERLKDVFKPFNRSGENKTDGDGDNTGIGLGIASQLVVLMGGQMGVESQLGEGAEFWFELPAHTSGMLERVSEQGPISALPDPDGNVRHVLYIDDSELNLKLVEKILTRRPHIQVTTALTPGLGIQLALARKPDLILLDINMPGMDGYQVLDVLKSYGRTKNIPIIAVTANAIPEAVEKGAASKLDAYITKPLDVPKFLATVDYWLEQSQSQSQTAPP
jgi:PAS domain S-box-containing protein